MATILLLFIFTAFIGLGLPDSAFGAVWPEIYKEFLIDFSYGSFITTLISVGTVISSIFSVKLINKLGTGLTTALSTTLTAIALLGFSFANGFWLLLLLAVPLGLGAGAIDSALNNFVALHYKATAMNFLHCFYGIGVMASPFIMSLAISGAGGWRGGYRLVFYVQIAISALMFLSLSLWNKVGKQKKLFDTETDADSVKPQTSLKEIIKMPSVRTLWLVFIGSCAVEFTCGNWGSTFFVEAEGLSTDTAAMVMTFYYGGIAFGRFLSGILSFKVKPWRIIKTGQAVTLLGIILIALPLGEWSSVAGICIIGIGNGPVFPNLAYLTPYHFGADKSQAVMGTQMTACYVGVTIMPLIFGFLASGITIKLFPYYLVLMYAVMIIGEIIFLKKYHKDESVEKKT